MEKGYGQRKKYKDTLCVFVTKHEGVPKGLGSGISGEGGMIGEVRDFRVHFLEMTYKIETKGKRGESCRRKSAIEGRTLLSSTSI